MGTLHIYNASAGSGKTYSLVREYLAVLLCSPRADAYRGILAVTFTNKAAWEMKRRILWALESFSTGGDAGGMGDYVAQRTGLPPGELRRRSAEALESLFNDYSAFSVSTIDSFTTRLVRSFSRELNLPVGFNIIVDADDILRQAVDMLLMRAGQDGKLSDLLVDFVLRNIDQGSGWDISSILFSGGKMTQDEGNSQPLERLAEKGVEDYLDLQRRLTAYKKAVEKEVSSLGKKACDIIYRELGSDKILAGGANGIASFFRKASQGRVLELDPGSTAVEKFFGGKYASASATAEQKMAVGERYQQLCSIAENLCTIVEKEKQVYAYADMVLAPLSRMSVAREIESEVGHIKQRSAVMLLHEFNHIVSRHLRTEPVPFIYEKIGERYKHYFIDEFQDTSALQWANLRELVYNQLAQDGTALVVGDAKQAIYRWRGGDTEQFVTLYESGGGLPSEQYRVQNLGINFRSRRGIVDFTNEFFTLCAPAAGNESFARVYREGNRQKSADPGEGFVSICNVEGAITSQRHGPMLLAVLDEINRVAGQDGYSYGDIAVLYRSNREGAALAEYLSANGVRVVSSESLLIVSSEAVRVLAAVMRFIAYPDDLQARATVLNFLEKEGALTGYDSDRRKAGYVSGSPGAFFDLLEESSGGKYRRAEALRQPLYECAEYIAGAFSLWGSGQDAYLLAFLDLIAAFLKDDTASMVAFLEYWDDKKGSTGIPGGDTNGAVRLMTIHKAKGLEFPVVIVPFASWKISDREQIWAEVPQEGVLEGLPVAYVPLSGVKKYGLDELYAPYEARILLDNLNLLYVALTRARCQLHVVTSLDVPGRTVAEFFGLFLGNAEVRNDDDPGDIYVYSAGKRGNGSGESTLGGDTYLLEGIASSLWRDRLRVSLDWKKVWAEPVRQAVETGNILHELLSMVEVSSQVDAAVSRGLNAGMFPAKDATQMCDRVNAVVRHPALNGYFEKPWIGVTEREMMTAEGRVLRPDRVCIDGQRAVVIDYKTGAPRTGHRAQVQEYSQVLSRMGYEVEKSILVYLDGENIGIEEC